MSQTALARASFHEPHLTRVSRSFAYGIGRLEIGLRADVGLGYLLCRLLDTVEDASWTTPQQQLDAFASFNRFLTTRASEAEIRAWARTFPLGVPDGERVLLEDSPHVFSEFHALSLEKQVVMKRPILSMSAGMQFFTGETRETGRLKVDSLTQANAYCLFVAGVVGELLTGLVNLALKTPSLDRATFVDGCHFGLFLQKINILKDQSADQLEGRNFVPDRVKLLASLRTHADHALRYLLRIPVERADYRLFCAWALYLGLATVPLLEAADPNGGEAPKLSRTRALFLGGTIELAICDDVKLKALYDGLMKESTVLSAFDSGPMKHNDSARSDEDVEVAESAADPIIETSLALYDGELSPDEIVGLLTVR